MKSTNRHRLPRYRVPGRILALVAPTVALGVALWFPETAASSHSPPPAAPAATAAVQPATASGTGVDCSGAPPPAAAAAGYTELLFCDDFSSIASIDMEAAGCPPSGKGPCAARERAGYKWFRAGKPFNYPETPKSDLSVRDGVLTINGIAPSMTLMTTYARDSGGNGGFSVRGRGAYFEAAIAFDAPPEQWLAANTVRGRAGGKPPQWRDGWPAFWTMDTCHLYGQCSPYMELDFFEYATYAFAGRDTYSGSLHRWLDLNTMGTPCGGGRGGGRGGFRGELPKCHQKEQSNNWSLMKTGFLGARGTGANNIIRVPDNTDWAGRFNVVGTLLERGEGIDYFFNNKVYTRNAYAQYPWLRIADQGDYPVILGSKNWPMRVDWVRVWGKPQR